MASPRSPRESAQLADHEVSDNSDVQDPDVDEEVGENGEAEVDENGEDQVYRPRIRASQEFLRELQSMPRVTFGSNPAFCRRFLPAQAAIESSDSEESDHDSDADDQGADGNMEAKNDGPIAEYQPFLRTALSNLRDNPPEVIEESYRDFPRSIFEALCPQPAPAEGSQDSEVDSDVDGNTAGQDAAEPVTKAKE